MALTTYTTYPEVRAVLGVSSTELPDSVLSLGIYGTMADLGLEDVHADIPASFSTVSALPSPTTQQQRFVDLVKLYVPYLLAKELLTSLPMFAVKQLSDGRAEFQRQADIYDDLKDGIDSALLSLRFRLAAAYNTLYPDAGIATGRATFNITVASGLATDPVTNA